MAELLADGQQARTVAGAWDDAVAAQLAAEDLDLGFEEPDTSVATGGAGFNKEVCDDVEPA